MPRLLGENTDLSKQLTATVDSLVAGARKINDANSAAQSVVDFSTLAVIIAVVLSLSLDAHHIVAICQPKFDSTPHVPKWWYVGDCWRTTARSVKMGGDVTPKWGEWSKFSVRNTLERDELLAEKAQAAERLEHEVKQRTVELAQSVQELRALGDVSQAVNSTIDLQTVLSTIVAKAVQLSGTEAGTIYVFDEASQEFKLRASYGMDDALASDNPVL